jgi:hypothetical protein
MVRRWRLIGYFPILYNPPPPLSLSLCCVPAEPLLRECACEADPTLGAVRENARRHQQMCTGHVSPRRCLRAARCSIRSHEHLRAQGAGEAEGEAPSTPARCGRTDVVRALSSLPALNTLNSSTAQLPQRSDGRGCDGAPLHRRRRRRRPGTLRTCCSDEYGKLASRYCS